MASMFRPFRSLRRSTCVKSSHGNGIQSRVLSSPLHQSRSYATEQTETSENPILDQYLKRQAARPQAPEGSVQGGKLSRNSIFANVSTKNEKDNERDPAAMQARLDPNPRQRRRWERKMVIQEIKKRGRVGKDLKIMRTERQLILRSDFWRTSVKKLSPLARQIQGKTVEEAIVQMKFSKKKAAKSIHTHLLQARDRAIVERGMGLGDDGRPLWIQLKDGTNYKVRDRTAIYVDQAWVGRGSFGSDVMKRAKGRYDQLRLPQTSISVLLKEDKTRIRLHEERKEKERKKKPWLQLPDRPIPAQRPYYSW